MLLPLQHLLSRPDPGSVYSRVTFSHSTLYFAFTLFSVFLSQRSRELKDPWWIYGHCQNVSNTMARLALCSCPLSLTKSGNCHTNCQPVSPGTGDSIAPHGTPGCQLFVWSWSQWPGLSSCHLKIYTTTKSFSYRLQHILWTFLPSGTGIKSRAFALSFISNAF